jgi:hypothetical protein
LSCVLFSALALRIEAPCLHEQPKSVQIFVLLFSTEICSFALISTKIILGYILGEFLTDPSGHPGIELLLLTVFHLGWPVLVLEKNRPNGALPDFVNIYT